MAGSSIEPPSGHFPDSPGQLVAFGHPILEKIRIAGRTIGQQRHRVFRIVVLRENHDPVPG